MTGSRGLHHPLARGIGLLLGIGMAVLPLQAAEPVRGATDAGAENPRSAPMRLAFNPREGRLRYGRVAEFDFNPEDVDAERDFGREVAAQLLGRFGRDDEEALNRYVSRVGHYLAEYANRPEVPFHFAVLDTDEVSAFAAPGGYVFVSRGALELMEDEAELAGVLGHEIIHVSERHIVEELDIRGGESGVVSGLARIIGGSGDPARAAFSQAVDEALGILLSEGLSQDDELEADRLGTFLAASAGYEPAALSRFIGRVEAEAGDTITDGLAKTHPPYGERLEAMNAFLVEQGLDGVAGRNMRERFREQVDAR